VDTNNRLLEENISELQLFVIVIVFAAIETCVCRLSGVSATSEKISNWRFRRGAQTTRINYGPAWERCNNEN